MSRTLLIVEESLRDLKAHWFEYIKTISQAAQDENYQVDVACHREAVLEIQNQFNSFPIFRYARYLDNHLKKLPGERYYGFVLHSLRSLKVLWPLLSRRDRYSHIFVPTVLPHHLLAWWLLLRFHWHRPQHLTLFFVANPGMWDSEKQASYIPKSPMVKIQRSLLRWFKPMVKSGIVTLGVETKGAKQEFEELTGLPFQQFPHPVTTFAAVMPRANMQAATTSLLFACYGFARYEKGSDLLKAAIEEVVATDDNSPIFCIQWVDSFALPSGDKCDGASLSQYSQVQVIDRPLASDEYQLALTQTSCMILPYRNSSYYARLSRIAIESACMGIPMIYTKGGWLEEIVNEFGAGVGIRDESVEELVGAVAKVQKNYEILHQQAQTKRDQARQYFSGRTFCHLLLQESQASVNLNDLALNRLEA